MNRQDIENKLHTLRIEYAKPATGKQRRQEIEAEAKQLKKIKANLCYQCKASAMTEIHFPFCTAKCHELWAEENVHVSGKGEQKPISFMQERLKQMGKESAKR